MQALHFLYYHADTVIKLSYLCMAITLVANIVCNVYARDNRAINQACKLLFSQHIAIKSVGIALPRYYRVCFQLWLTVKTKKASGIITFLPKKQPVRLLLLPALLLLCAIMCAAIDYFIYSSDKLFYSAMLSICCFIYVLLIIKQVFALKQKSALSTVRRLGEYLDLLYSDNQDLTDNALPIQCNVLDEGDNQEEQVVKKLNFLIDKGVPLDSAQKIAKYITPSQLNAPRTVSAQQQLNTALNGLIKVISVAEKQVNKTT